MKDLTKLQRDTFDYLIESIIEKGYQPSFQDFCDEFEITKGAVVTRINALERKGYISRTGKERALQIIKGKIDYKEAAK